jgi:hypothetical protein
MHHHQLNRGVISQPTNIGLDQMAKKTKGKQGARCTCTRKLVHRHSQDREIPIQSCQDRIAWLRKTDLEAIQEVMSELATELMTELRYVHQFVSRAPARLVKQKMGGACICTIKLVRLMTQTIFHSLLSATQLISASFDVPRPHLVCRPTFADTTRSQGLSHNSVRLYYYRLVHHRYENTPAAVFALLKLHTFRRRTHIVVVIKYGSASDGQGKKNR